MTTAPTTRAIGDTAEARALTHLVATGQRLVARNYRVARGPRVRGGEVDLIRRDGDGMLVVAASRYLRRFAAPPPCRFDIVSVEGDRIKWLSAASDASAG